MKDMIEAVASELLPKFWKRDQWNSEYFDGIGYSEALVAELSKRAEASCVSFQHEDTGRTTSVAHDEADDFERLNQRWFKVGPLFTFQPINDIEAIENQVAEACAKVCMGPNNDGNIFADDCAEVIRSGKWRKYK